VKEETQGKKVKNVQSVRFKPEDRGLLDKLVADAMESDRSVSSQLLHIIRFYYGAKGGR